VLGVSAELQFSQDRFTTFSVHWRSLFGRAASPCSQPQSVVKIDEVRLARFSVSNLPGAPDISTV